MFGHKYSLEHICSFNHRLQMPPETIGRVADGLRVTIYITGGDFTGPRLRGKVRPVGGDWGVMRPDGVFVIDVRSTFETQDGALLYVTYSGLIDAGRDGYERLQRGEIATDGTPFRTTPRFQTGHPAYEWANRIVCVGMGELHMSVPEVRYDVYAIN